jgi:hypothetical protein
VEVEEAVAIGDEAPVAMIEAVEVVARRAVQRRRKRTSSTSLDIWTNSSP